MIPKEKNSFVQTLLASWVYVCLSPDSTTLDITDTNSSILVYLGINTMPLETLPFGIFSSTIFSHTATMGVRNCDMQH